LYLGPQRREINLKRLMLFLETQCGNESIKKKKKGIIYVFSTLVWNKSRKMKGYYCVFFLRAPVKYKSKKNDNCYIFLVRIWYEI